MKHLFWVAILFCLFSSCEKMDLDDDTDDNPGIEHITPISIGNGTQLSPYSVTDVLNGIIPDHKAYWFIGYAVGSTYSSINNALFEAETSYKTNILLSDNPNCEDASTCIPIELNTSSIQKALSLYYQSEHFRQCVMVQGHTGDYFRVKGLRSVEAGYWLPDLDLSILERTTPTEWQEWNITY